MESMIISYIAQGFSITYRTGRSVCLQKKKKNINYLLATLLFVLYIVPGIIYCVNHAKKPDVEIIEIVVGRSSVSEPEISPTYTLPPEITNTTEALTEPKAKRPVWQYVLAGFGCLVLLNAVVSMLAPRSTGNTLGYSGSRAAEAVLSTPTTAEVSDPQASSKRRLFAEQLQAGFEARGHYKSSFSVKGWDNTTLCLKMHFRMSNDLVQQKENRELVANFRYEASQAGFRKFEISDISGLSWEYDL
jgi:hypothetical protein